MIKFSFIPVVAILAIFSTLIISCEETKTLEQMQIATKDFHDKRYEERKAEEQQFIKGAQDEREEVVEKKIEEAEREKEHNIHHKKDSTHRKDVEKAKK